jgi:Tfp pilus assembly protein PilE
MGQQQLLLVILVTIIVGIATVVAINTFSTSADQANQDAVRQDLASIAAAAQAWYIRPTMLEGGGNTFSSVSFTTLNFNAQSRSANGLIAVNQNGRYEITQGAQSFTVLGIPRSNTATSTSRVNITATITPNSISLVSTNIGAGTEFTEIPAAGS